MWECWEGGLWWRARQIWGDFGWLGRFAAVEDCGFGWICRGKYELGKIKYEISDLGLQFGSKIWYNICSTPKDGVDAAENRDR